MQYVCKRIYNCSSALTVVHYRYINGTTRIQHNWHMQIQSKSKSFLHVNSQHKSHNSFYYYIQSNHSYLIHSVSVVATLMLHNKSRKIVRNKHIVLHLEKLKDSACAWEYAVTISNQFNMLGTVEDPVKLWNPFSHEIVEASKECTGEPTVKGWLCLRGDTGEYWSHAARLAVNHDQYRGSVMQN